MPLLVSAYAASEQLFKKSPSLISKEERSIRKNFKQVQNKINSFPRVDNRKMMQVKPFELRPRACPAGPGSLLNVSHECGAVSLRTLFSGSHAYAVGLPISECRVVTVLRRGVP
mgnify:CR=1 FL=1